MTVTYRIDLINESAPTETALQWVIADPIIQRYGLYQATELTTYLERHLRLSAQPDALKQAVAAVLGRPPATGRLAVTLRQPAAYQAAPEGVLRAQVDKLRAQADALATENSRLRNNQARQRTLADSWAIEKAELQAQLARCQADAAAQEAGYVAQLDVAREREKAQLEKLAAHQAKLTQNAAELDRLRQQMEEADGAPAVSSEATPVSSRPVPAGWRRKGES